MTLGDKFFGDIEEKVAAIHICFERLPGLVAHLRPPGFQLGGPTVKHVKKRLAVIGQPNRLKENSRRNPLRRGLDETHAVGPANAHTGHMEILNSQMIHQRQLVFRVGLPAIRGTDRSGRLAGVALVHGDHAIAGRKLLNGIPGGLLPKGYGGAHPSGRDE